MRKCSVGYKQARLSVGTLLKVCRYFQAMLRCLKTAPWSCQLRSPMSLTMTGSKHTQGARRRDGGERKAWQSKYLSSMLVLRLALTCTEFPAKKKRENKQGACQHFRSSNRNSNVEGAFGTQDMLCPYRISAALVYPDFLHLDGRSSTTSTWQKARQDGYTRRLLHGTSSHLVSPSCRVFYHVELVSPTSPDFCVE